MSVEIPPPTQPEILEMLKQYIQAYLVDEPKAGPAKKPINVSVFTDWLLTSVVDQLYQHKFVGRDITNFVISLSQSAYSSSEFALTDEMVYRTLSEQVAKRDAEQKFEKLRAKRLRAHFGVKNAE